MRKLFLYAALLLLSQCSKCKDNDPTPEEQLPPATQTGANTFGCLINGQAWTPFGNPGSPNYVVTYDAGLGGLLSVRATRYTKSGTDFQNIVVFAENVTGPGSYDLGDASRTRASFYDTATGCDVNSRDAGTYNKGRLIVTKLDLPGRIIAGTFEFKIYKPGCDTIRVTNGRFDYKL